MQYNSTLNYAEHLLRKGIFTSQKDWPILTILHLYILNLIYLSSPPLRASSSLSLSCLMSTPSKTSIYVEYKRSTMGGIMKISCKFSEFDYKRRTEELASEPQSTFPAPLLQTHIGKNTNIHKHTSLQTHTHKNTNITGKHSNFDVSSKTHFL